MNDRDPRTEAGVDGEPALGAEVMAEVAQDFPADEQWRRLSPRMLLVHPVREVIRFLPVLIGLLIAGSAGGGQNWWSLIGTGVAVALGLLRWFTTTYRFNQAQVQLRRGLLNKTTISAPMDRIRSVDVTATILHRALGLAEVKIGTGAGESELKLDGLSAPHAAALREDLLHRRGAGAPTSDPGPAADGAAAPVGDGTAEGVSLVKNRASQDELIYALDPAWIRYAPFSPAGLIAALAIFAVGGQIIRDSGLNVENNAQVQSTWSSLEGLGVALAVIVGIVVLLLVMVILSVGGYVLSFWGFRLAHNEAGGSFHTSRGLLTTRATSLEKRRLRGVELHEAVPLRWARGATLRAITTGVKDEGRGMSSTLAPSSPRDVVCRTADLVLGTPGALATPLQSHGAAATQRRYTRALGTCAVPAVALIALAFMVGRAWIGALAVLPLLLGIALGRSRANALGHAITARFLVARSGAITRRTSVVERDGAVAVGIRASFFQRRAGVATVQLATAAGRQRYDVLDVPSHAAVDLAEQILPGYVAQFRE
ncbi:PH domain-containing protein [Leekyejoonella antrihumi]|uniref:YdbS-like PH domain-containing protein n=1 Tax=Leekyejoonella antrihumi TaxID=1660198 RepID=A0A563E7U0_9MICO|nr:PH domain-containing protein [Leekyejoonella antrihumi]TWP38648.1 hypothetical protein FGL98_02375 [Leekyejoonella antrihumi]